MEEKKVVSTNKIIIAFTDLVGLFDSKPRAFVTVSLILVILYLYSDNKQLNKQIIDDNKEGNRREVAIYQRLIDRYDPKIHAMQLSTDSTKLKVDSTTSKMAPVIEKINKTMDYIKKKK